VIASLARQSPALAWLMVTVLLVLGCLAAVAAEDWWNHRKRRHRRPSWAKWRRIRRIWHAARYRYALTRLYLDAHLGI
jgi:hypothetical protein